MRIFCRNIVLLHPEQIGETMVNPRFSRGYVAGRPKEHNAVRADVFAAAVVSLREMRVKGLAGMIF